MTDTDIREFFGLDETADLDKPIANLGFLSYREAAQAHFEKWGAETKMQTKDEHDQFCNEFAATWASEKSLKSTLREYIATVKDYETFLAERKLSVEFKEWLNRA